MFNWKRRSLLALLAMAATMPAVQARAGYPDKPIRLVVPYPPGGPTDTLARLIGKGLAGEFGQPVIVENRPGASSTIGTAHVAHQPADGYTLLVVAAQLVTNAATGIKAPYDPLRDLEPVANLAWMPILVAANPKLPPKDLPSLIEWIKNQREPVQYSSPGTGSLTQLWAELLAQRYKLKMQNIPYQGSAGAARAVVAGQVPLIFDVAGITGTMIREGKLRGIVTPGATRAPGLPNVPTANESGIKDLNAASFLGLMAPAHTPTAVVGKLNAAVNRVLRSADVARAIDGLSMVPAGGSPDEFGKLLTDEMKRWSAVAKVAGIKIEH